MRKSEEYYEGIEAWKFGFLKSDCPHLDPVKALDWNEGYDRAKAKEETLACASSHAD